jgi:AraC family transcriptional regulator
MMSRAREADHRRRLNRAIDLVVERLGEDLPLARLARAACFSPFHFHRVFRAATGETVKAFTLRVRLERALFLLKTGPRRPLKEVAAACGFRSAAVFSRAFRRAYGATPGAIDVPAWLRKRKNRQAFPIASRYHLRSLPADMPPLPVTIETLPARRIAYLRVANPYAGDAVARAFARVLAWCDGAGLGPASAQLIGLAHDDPEVTPLAQCNYDVAVTVPRGAAVPEEFSLRTIPAGPFAVCRCTGDIHAVDRAWNFLFKAWLPRSRWQPANFPALEIFAAWPREPQTAAWDLWCCVPLAPRP